MRRVLAESVMARLSTKLLCRRLKGNDDGRQQATKHLDGEGEEDLADVAGKLEPNDAVVAAICHIEGFVKIGDPRRLTELHVAGPCASE